MTLYFAKIDQFSTNLAEYTIRYRYFVVICTLFLVGLFSSGSRFLEFESNYRAFFSDENKELITLETLQATYTKNDNILFVIKAKDQQIFSRKVLEAIEWLTEAAWQIPYASRVDSITNFQHTYGNEDGLIVEDLIENAPHYSNAQLLEKSRTATAEPLLRKLLITPDTHATAVNVTLQYPQESIAEVPEAVNYARHLRQKMENKFDSISVYMTGISMLNNAFSEAGLNDTKSLIPLMFGIIFLLTWLILRSFSATLTTLLITFFSSVIAMGIAGFTGIHLTPIATTAPTIILTLAIADSIHILITMRMSLTAGSTKEKAITEAVKLNFLPVSITSITTMVGFLTLNFSDSPPFWHLGNMTAMGIGCAWILSVTFLPALMYILPFHVKAQSKPSRDIVLLDKLANIIVRYPKPILLIIGTATLILITFIPRIELNDQWTEYFDNRIEFRRDSDQSLKYFGMYPIEYSVPATGPGGVSDPSYLAELEKFSNFLRQQSEVVHVYSVTDIMKRLNKNLHADDPNYYIIPKEKELSAQYLLLYELSLPYGLDLNDRINIDKSATRLTATLTNTSTLQTKQFLETTQQWIHENLPPHMQSIQPTSPQVMFTYIAERNINNMIGGTIIAVLAISIILFLTLRSWRLGILSLIPNGLPLLTTFGSWGYLVGEVGFSVATVASISLGIIVDDTVHLLSKYIRAKREQQLNAADAIRYALRNVGVAILANTTILSAGFLVLTASAFKVNVDMGALTAIAIISALILDFLFLPALLILVDNIQNQRRHNVQTEKKSSSSSKALASLVLALGIMSSHWPEVVTANELTPIQGNTPNERKGFEIVAKSERSDLGFGNSKVNLTMILRNKAGQESKRNLIITTLEAENESVGDKSLALFTSPKDIDGTALLSHAKILEADDQWLYLPALKRVKRISSRNKSGPFVGSEFAFEDFSSQSLNKYRYKWLREEPCGSEQCDVIERKPRYKHSGYTQQVMWVDQTIYQPRKIEYYDRRNAFLKTLTLKDYTAYGQYWRAHSLKMVNHINKKSTLLSYGPYEFNLNLSDKDFVKGRLIK